MIVLLINQNLNNFNKLIKMTKIIFHLFKINHKQKIGTLINNRYLNKAYKKNQRYKKIYFSKIKISLIILALINAIKAIKILI